MLEPKVVFVTAGADVATGLEVATQLARERSATLVIMHVVPLSSESGEAMLLAAMDLLSEDSERRLLKLTPQDPAVPFVHVHETGDPEACITAFVAREQVSLVVIEAPPRPWLTRTFGRALHERLIERCACPIVTYRPRRDLERRASSADAVSSPRPRVSSSVLTAILNARVELLVSWMQRREDAVKHVAQQRSVAHAVAALYRAGPSSALFTQRTRNMLLLELAEYQRGWGAIGVEVVGSDQVLLQIGARARRTQTYERFVGRVFQAGKAASVPLEEDPGDNRRLVMAGASIPGMAEDVALNFVFDARRDFMRILAQPGPTPSVETYAFDASGVMLSNSRFPDQLRRIGILPKDISAQTPGRVRVCDPGGNLLLGAGSLADSLPLTRAVAHATAGNDGSDFTGYRDYRGVEVVGVWRWLEEYRFGVTAEVDLDALGA